MPTDNRLDGSGLTFYHNNTLPAGNNLIHNADWGYSLVNQRGHTGSVAASKYCIDRWYNAGSAAGTVTPSAGSHVTLASGTVLAQKMEIIPDALLGKTVTFAYQDSSNNIYKTTLTFPLSASGADVTATVGSLSVAIGFIVGTVDIHGVSCASVPYVKLTANSAVNIRRVWLELGYVCHMEITPPMEYSTALSICSRYFQRLDVPVYGPVGHVVTESANYAIDYVTVQIPLRFTLRKTPNFSTWTTSTILEIVTGSMASGVAKDYNKNRPMEVNNNVPEADRLVTVNKFHPTYCYMDANGVLLLLYCDYLQYGRGIHYLSRSGRIFEFSADL